jgi:hypothetical protein
MIKKLSWNFFSIATGYVFSPFCYLETKILLQASILLGATFGSISVLTAYNSNQTILQFRAFFLSSLLIVMCTKITVSCLPSYALIKIAHSTLIYGGIALSYGLISTSTFHMINRAQLNPIFNPLLHAAHIYLDLFILISQMI